MGAHDISIPYAALAIGAQHLHQSVQVATGLPGPQWVTALSIRLP